MTVTLAQAKNYLRVSSSDDDTLITSMITTAVEMCASVTREKVEDYIARTDQRSFLAVLFAIAYLYEHREEANHNGLLIDIRAIFNDREAVF